MSGLSVYVLLSAVLTPASLQQTTGCPHFFKRFGDSCYHVFDTPLLSWNDAMGYCGYYGEGEGRLAEVETEAEQLFLEKELRAKFPNPTGRDYWLGANDVAQEGSWIWIRKDALVSYNRWGPGQPSSGRSENCLALYDNLAYHWNDAPCNLPEAFICEIPWNGDTHGQQLIG